MDIRLNKELQNKLDIFVSSKGKKLSDFKKICDIDEFTYSKQEIDAIQDLYTQSINEDNLSIKEYIYIYIGEALIHNAGGEWSIGKLKKDEAYGQPIILHYGNPEKDHIRIFPEAWLYRLENGTIRTSISQLIEICKE